MKKLTPLLLGICVYSTSYAQEVNSTLYDKYSKYSFTAYDILSASRSARWTPSKQGAFKGSFNYFEEVVIGFAKQDLKALEQMRLTACYQCSIVKYAEYHLDRYNRLYTPVDFETWFKDCPYLFTSMDIDKSLK